jgi:hypothetical protein
MLKTKANPCKYETLNLILNPNAITNQNFLVNYLFFDILFVLFSFTTLNSDLRVFGNW